MRVQLLFILLLLIGCDKTENIEIVEPELEVISDEHFKIINNLTIYDSKLLEDGSLIISGTDTGLNGNINNSHLARINTFGDLDTFVFLPSDNQNTFKKIRFSITQDNNVILLSSVQNSLTFSTDLSLLNPSFQTLWNVSIGGEENAERGDSMEQLPNGDYILISSILSEISFSNHYLIRRISPIGDVIWSNKIVDDNISDLTKLIYLEEDNSFIVMSEHYGGIADIGKIKLTKFNIEGVQEISNTIVNNKLYFPNISGMKQLSDGNILAHYSSFNTRLNQLQVNLVKLQPNLSVIWEVEYSDFEDDLVKDIFECNDGSILVLSESTFKENDIVVTRIDSEGSIFWRKVYGGDSFETATNIFERPNSNILVTGNSVFRDGFTLELNSNGNPF